MYISQPFKNLNRLTNRRGVIKVKLDVARAIQGDQESLEILLSQTYPTLYRTAFLYVKNEADALDIVQDTFEKIIQNIHTLEEIKYFQTWAIRITIYQSLDFLKRAHRTNTELKEEYPQNYEFSIDDKLDIYQAIEKLPIDLQEITILHYFNGKKLQEISLISGEPLGTIKYKLHRIRQLLRNYLEGGNEDETE